MRGMKNPLLATVIFLLLFLSTTNAQKMTRISKIGIRHDGTALFYNDSEHLFKTVPSSHEIYIKSKKAFKTAKVFGIAALGSVGVGVILSGIPPDPDMYCDTFCFSTAQVIGFITAGIGFPLFGTIGVIANNIGKSKQRKAIDLYNNHYGNSLSDSRSQVIWSFGFSENGMGIVVRF